MKLYTATYTNDLYTYGDSITQDEYDQLYNKTQFTFWYDTSEVSESNDDFNDEYDDLY